MNITDYTNGPWEAKDQWGYIKIHSKNEGVCAVHGLGVNSQANARLIAAAPDLLSALEELLKREGETEFNSVGVELKTDALEKAICKAKSAIAKAKGAA